MSKDENSIDAGLLRIVEAVLFAAEEPLNLPNIADKLPDGTNVAQLLEAVQTKICPSGV